MSVKTIAKNRKAKHDYFILETYEAGIVLLGSEIKSIRDGKVSIKEAYVRVDGEEAWLVDAHIAPHDKSSYYNHDPKRPRKLLLHKKQILDLWDEVRIKGTTIIPLQLYLRDNIAKVEIGVAKGKKQYDKRREIAKRDAEREIERQLSRRSKY